MSSARLRRRRRRRKADSDDIAFQSHSSIDLTDDGRVGGADGRVDGADGRVGGADGRVVEVDDMVGSGRKAGSCASVDVSNAESLKVKSEDDSLCSNSESDLISQGSESEGWTTEYHPTEQQHSDEVEDLFTLLDDTLREEDQKTSKKTTEDISDEDQLSSSLHPLLSSGRLADRARALRQ